jgi:DNA repair exonuclease SbcCD ATPase subunit
MKLLKLRLENFRGVREATYDFTDLTKIKGQNGSGKSTIFSSWTWLFVDRDSTLVSNPPVRPIDAIDEQVTTVTADIEISGKQVQVQKSQKLKRSKSGTVSLTNSYMVNSVPKSERDFKEYMSNLGFDFDKFLQCSHPGVLLAGINNKKERDALRNMLFQMASDITDVDVAKDDPELSELAKLLENYDTEEVAAIQNATLRKIRENYGKEGEILRAKIEGLESAKTEVDVDNCKNKISDLESFEKEIQSKIDAGQRGLDNISNISAGIMEKKFKLNQMEQDAVKDDIAKKSELEKSIFVSEKQIEGAKQVIRSMEKSIAEDESIINQARMFLPDREQDLEKQKSKEFKDDLVCPTCGQKMPEAEVEKARQRFLANQKEIVDRLTESIQSLKDSGNEAFKRMKSTKAQIIQSHASLDEMKSKLDVMKAELAEIKINDPDMSDNVEYQDLLESIANDEIVVAECASIKEQIESLKSELRLTEQKKKSYEMELLKEKQNNRIDSQIAEAKEQQVAYEQSKADAEMILHQLKVLNMKKNELLQESVNKNFSLISWKLFDYRKNGETFDTCIPMIDGKAFGESMNNALETMAKIDAMNGIQKFFGLDFPIWLDNAEHLDSQSLASLKTDHQLIVLTVTDDERLVFVND